VAPDDQAPAASLPPSGEDPLLERERQLGVLQELVRQADDGHAVLALVEGPAGIGKTRLLAAAREMASAAGFRVLTARGSDLEQEFAFGVVRQLFEPLLADPAERARWLAGAAEPAARAFGPPSDGGAAGDVSFDLLHGLFWLTASIAAERRLLLSIDDLHWCDQASLRFLAYLERRLEGLQVLIAGAARPAEQRTDTRLLAEIARDPAAVTIRPVALSEAAVAELVRNRLGAGAEQRFCAACHEATGGNPLLLGELLKALEAEGVEPDAAHARMIDEIGPQAVSRTVLLRLARLPADAVAVARALAVLGDGAGLPVTARLAELDEGSVADATVALARAEILRAEPPVGFVHPLVRDAVYHELTASERELQHERAAKALVDLGATPEVVAAHLLAVPARGEAWVAALLREAGLAAERHGATESAVVYLRRALEEPLPAEQREQLLLELGLMEGRVNARAAVEHISQVTDRLVDPRTRALAAAVLGRMLLFTGPAQEAAAVVRRALADLPADDARARRGLEAFELYTVAFGADVPNAAERLARVRAAGVEKGLGGSMLAAVAAWDWAVQGGTAEECAELALGALASGRLVSVDPGCMAVAAAGALGLADRDEALSACDAMMTGARRLGALIGVTSVNVWQGFTWLRRGELAEAEAVLRQALDGIALMEEQNGAGKAYAVGFLARVLVERGDLVGARAALASCPEQSPASDGEALIRHGTIELLLEEGRWQQALAEVDAYRARLRSEDGVAWAPWRSLKALALDGLGRRDEAIELLEHELAVARRWGGPGPLARALRLLGTMRRPRGLELVHEAIEVARDSPARLELAKALTTLGSALRHARQPSKAREPLREALQIAGHCGAEPLAERARSELYAAGGRPRREAATGPESLTPSERRVADLAAQGQRNRDIAHALYVTPKTVEVHLTNIYRKLGITGRVGLAEALAR
jgi:DNA-binding CsgD family transcriptional regulator